MTKPRGKTPSLISGSSGKPTVSTAGRKTKCCRCKADILKNEKHFKIPKVGGGFSSPKPFCFTCFQSVLCQTKADLIALEAQFTNLITS